MKTFLPSKDPLITYITKSSSLKKIHLISNQIPKLLLTGNIQTTINSLSTNSMNINALIKKSNISCVEIFVLEIII